MSVTGICLLVLLLSSCEYTLLPDCLPALKILSLLYAMPWTWDWSAQTSSWLSVRLAVL